MPVNRGPGVRQIGAIGTTPKEHRLALAGQYAENAPGVPRSGLLVQAATNVVTPTAATGTMTYLVAEVASVIGRGVGDGVYTPTTVGATIANRTVATANSPASGSRWDLVWIKQNDQEKGDLFPVVAGVPDNSAILGVTSGTAAASPIRPTGSVPAGALILSEHQIFSGTASTTASPNTSTPVFPVTAARGAQILVRSVAERDTITAPAIGQAVVRADRDGFVQAWDGTKWQWVTRATRYFATTFTTAVSPDSRVICTVTPPTKTYATRVSVHGRLMVRSGTISAGAKVVNVAVSTVVGVVTTAQGKAQLAWNANTTGLNQNANPSAYDVAVAAGVSPVSRLWIEDLGGTITTEPSGPPYASFYVDVLPEDD